MNSTRQTGRPGAAKTDSSAPSQAAAAQASAPLPHVERVKTALVQIDSVEQFSGGFAVRRKRRSWFSYLFFLYPLFFALSGLFHGDIKALAERLPVFGGALLYISLLSLTAALSERSLRPLRDKLRSADLVDAAVNAAFNDGGILAATSASAQAALNSNLRRGDARRLWIALGSWPWLLRPQGRNQALDAQASQVCGWLVPIFLLGTLTLSQYLGPITPAPLPHHWQWWTIGAALLSLVVSQTLTQRRNAGRSIMLEAVLERLELQRGESRAALLAPPLRERVGESLLSDTRSTLMVLLALTGILPLAVALAGAHGISEYAPMYEVPIACWALASGLLPLVPAFFIIRNWAAGLAPLFRRTNLLLDISARAELRGEAPKPSLPRQLTSSLNQVSSPLEAEIIDTGRKLGQYCPWATPSLPLIAVIGIVWGLLTATCGTALLGGPLDFRSMEDLSAWLWPLLFAPGLISAILPYGVAAALAQEEYQRYIRAQLSPARGEAPEE